MQNRIKELRMVPASDLHAHPGNWRTHPSAQSNALQAVLDSVGIVDAVIAREMADGSLELVDGHLRSNLAGDDEIPVLVVDLSDGEADTVLATLDPLSAMAGADTDRLAELLGGLAEIPPIDYQQLYDFDLTPAAGPEADEPVPAPAEPVTELGDIWVCGQHRLMCGDSTNTVDVARLLAGEHIDLCFTSPPYLHQRDYTTPILDWDTLMQGVFANLVMCDDGQVLVNLGMAHRDGEWVPYWDSWVEWMRQEGWRRFSLIVWDKGAGMPGDYGGRFCPTFEFVFHFNRKSRRLHKIQPNKSAGEIHTGSGTRRADGTLRTYDADGQQIAKTRVHDDIIRVGRAHGGDGHPAPFPVGLPEPLIASFTDAGQLVYDPFAGSGTTIIAAERQDRRCYAMELDPGYVDAAVARWENLTGQEATDGNA